MSNVIAFPKARIVRIPPAHQDDVRLTFARLVEQRFHAMERTMEGKLPTRFCEAVRPTELSGIGDDYEGEAS